MHNTFEKQGSNHREPTISRLSVDASCFSKVSCIVIDVYVIYLRTQRENIPSIGVVIGSKKRRFCFKRRRLSCRSSEPTGPFSKALLRASFAKFSGVGKECTRPEESRFRAKDPKERMDTFMKKAGRTKSAVMG